MRRRRRSAAKKLAVFQEQIRILETDLAEAHAKVERAMSMAERTRTGYVYIISNVGSFGEGVVKIGLTRRLDPSDRVRELGDASVPFIFDTHAIIYSDDAPAWSGRCTLNLKRAGEHEQFPKGFFRVSLDEVEAAVARLAPGAPFIRISRLRNSRRPWLAATLCSWGAGIMIEAEEELPAEI